MPCLWYFKLHSNAHSCIMPSRRLQTKSWVPGSSWVPQKMTFRAATQQFIVELSRAQKFVMGSLCLLFGQAYPSTWFAATLYDGTVRLGSPSIQQKHFPHERFPQFRPFRPTFEKKWVLHFSPNGFLFNKGPCGFFRCL